MSPIKNIGSMSAEGALSGRVKRDLGELHQERSLAARIRNFIKTGQRGIGGDAFGHLSGAMSMQPSLAGIVYRPAWAQLPVERAQKLRDMLAANFDVHELVRHFGGELVDYGILSTRVVTTAGVNFLSGAFQGTQTISNMKFHGFGTGTTAEATTDTTLVTELTTQYAVDNTRVTGSQAAGGSANVYRTIATLSPDSGGTIAITEHGIFSAASSGTLWDRSVFSAVNLVAGSDSLQVTYDLTLTAGG